MHVPLLDFNAFALKEGQKQGKDVFIYFDNDQNAYAAFNAQKLMEFV